MNSWTIMSFRKINEWWTNELESPEKLKTYFFQNKQNTIENFWRLLAFIFVLPWKAIWILYVHIFLQTFPVLIQPGAPDSPYQNFFFLEEQFCWTNDFTERTITTNRHLVQNWTKLKKNNRFFGKQTNLNVTEWLKKLNKYSCWRKLNTTNYKKSECAHLYLGVGRQTSRKVQI